MKKISEIAQESGIPESALIPFGHFIAKLDTDKLSTPSKTGNLILVTAITPNKAGVGKTTTSIGIAQGLKKIGKKAVVALREPSLGPCFGMKGGATGGGKSEVWPMEAINLHFTGDFHAITTANNMLAALVDNHQYFNKNTGKGLKQVLWKRVLDINDRSLRYIVSGLNGSTNGIPTEAGFDITPASEIMAIFCLAEDLQDLRRRIDQILIGYTFDNKPFTVKDLGVGGALLALLKDAFMPNLVQTSEGGPAIIHGGPFANIAHGCNSVMATKTALRLGEYVITEAGFGADLGGEKFLNIKCRKSGLAPKATVIVVSSQSLKLHGGAAEETIKAPNEGALQEGFKNLERHIENMQAFGQSVVVAFNRFPFDADQEIALVAEWCEKTGARFAVNDAFSSGGEGASDLARIIVEVVEKNPSRGIEFTYGLEEPIEEKLRKIVQQVYRGADITLGKKAKTMLKKIKELGMENLPVCIAKTQYSFSDDASATGVASGFTLHIEDLVINAGAEFIVAVAGDIMRMPGLPKQPQANAIDVVEGKIVGLG